MPIPQKNSPIERTNAKEWVLQTLSTWLVNGTLKPGERIYEDELSKYFNVSRTPVHEALQVLAEKKLVEILPSRGTRVAPINLEELQQIYPLLSHLHGFAVKLAFNKITPDILNTLENRNEALHQAILEDSLPQIQEADRLFHQELILLSGNHYLGAYIDDLVLHVERTENQFFEKETLRMQSIEGHNRIISALRDGDCEAAVQATEENWMLNFHLVIEKLLQQQ